MTPNGRPNSYDDYIYIMKWFVENRAAWMDSQFTPPVTVSPPGGVVPNPTEVTIDGPEEFDLYYTLDGSDPRQPLIVEQEQAVLNTGAAMQFHVPADGTLIGHCDDGLRLDDPDACFINPDYTLGHNGEVWTEGVTPLGFDGDGDYDALIQTDVTEAMADVSSSMYVRIPFQVDEWTKNVATSLNLRMRYDDGFVAYLWLPSLKIPAEVARSNAPGNGRTFPIIAVDAGAAATQTNPDEQAVTYETFDITKAIKWLRAGQNVLVIQLLNESAASNDLLLDAEITVGTTHVEVSPTVLRYQEPFSIDANTQVLARGFNPITEEWTGRAKVTYLVDVPKVAITEINYNPHAPTVAELAQDPQLQNDDFEFLEIRNVGPTAVNLVGASFTGFDFTFGNAQLESGQSGVVVRNAAAFALRYGQEVNVLGEFFGGGLSNGGERLSLIDSTGQVLLDFSYDDNELWPQAADGVGATLQLVDPAFATPEMYSTYDQWRASSEFGGSPGRVGGPPVGIVINEVLSRTDESIPESDSIELLNVTDQPMDLSGWYLSDAAGDLQKYRFPTGTLLGPGEYLVLDESDFNTILDDPDSFALSGTNGDDVWLTVADATGNVTGFADDVHFRAALLGESFGRTPNATGRLAPLLQRTLGTVNGLPRVGPVVISELQYHPG